MAAVFFRFLRQPSRPNVPRAVPNSGSAAGSGVSKERVPVPVQWDTP